MRTVGEIALYVVVAVGVVVAIGLDTIVQVIRSALGRGDHD